MATSMTTTSAASADASRTSALAQNAKLPAAKQLWRGLEKASSRFFAADGSRSDDMLVEVVRRNPSAATAFLRAVMIFSGIAGAVVSTFCIIFLALFWVDSGLCERPLRWWVLVNTALQLLQVPVRFVCLSRMRDTELAQSSMEECVASFTASPAWRLSKNVSLVTYAWCVLGVVWMINAGDCRACPGIYRVTVFVLLQALVRTIVALFSYRRLFPVEVFEEAPPKVEGATPHQIAALPLVSFTADLFPEHGASCAVCLSEYSRGEALRRLPCGHHFHCQCADEWLRRSKRCPLCIQAIDEAQAGPSHFRRKTE